MIWNTVKTSKEATTKQARYLLQCQRIKELAQLDMFHILSSSKLFDMVTFVFRQVDGVDTTVCNMIFLLFMTKIQIPAESDRFIDSFPPLKDNSNLSPRQILKFNIKTDPNLYGDVPT